MNASKKVCGMVAQFDDVPSVYNAAQKVRDAGFTFWDVHTPFPIHGMDAAMGLKRSKVPVFTMLCGLLGLGIAVLMVWYMNAYNYPLIVGGKPFFSPIFPFPVFYEMTILLAAFGTFFGMFIVNLLPRHHHPLFDFEGFERVMDDQFFIYIESKDAQYDAEKTASFLHRLGGKNVSLVED